MFAEYRRRLECPDGDGSSLLPDEWFVGKAMIGLFTWLEILGREDDEVFWEREGDEELQRYGRNP